MISILQIPHKTVRMPLHAEQATQGRPALASRCLGSLCILAMLVGCAALPLHQAAKKGDLFHVQRLVESGSDVNARDDFGRTPLMLAGGNVASMAIAWSLLDHGAWVNAQNVNGCTALMYACDEGDLKMVRLLLDKGANVNGACTWAGHYDIVHQQTRSPVVIRGYTPLMVAAEASSSRDPNRVPPAYLATVRLLLDRGADVNARNEQGYTAWMLAFRCHGGACIWPQSFSSEIVASHHDPHAAEMVAHEIISRGAYIDQNNAVLLFPSPLLLDAIDSVPSANRILLGRDTGKAGCYALWRAEAHDVFRAGVLYGFVTSLPPGFHAVSFSYCDYRGQESRTGQSPPITRVYERNTVYLARLVVGEPDYVRGDVTLEFQIVEFARGQR